MRMIRSVAAAIAGSLLLLVGLLALLGYDPAAALRAFWVGSFGSWYAFTSGTLVRATPLMIAGLATAIAFRAGVLNIGVEGQLLMGATFAMPIALANILPSVLTVPAALGAGVIGGTAWAAIPAFLKRYRGVLEVISTLLLNSVALYFVSWVVRGPLQEHTHTYPQSDLIPVTARLPIVIPDTRLHAGFALACGLVIMAGWIMSRTAPGFILRTVGANPFAAASAGLVNVGAVSFGALLISGGVAGLAGATEVLGVTYSLHEGISPGYGYTAIAVALLARLDPRAVIPSALLFASLESGAAAMQRDAGVPSVLVRVVEALLIIAVLVADARHRPTADAP